MERKEKAQPEGRSFKPERLDASLAESARAKHLHSGVSSVRKRAAEQAWMDKLRRGDYSGPALDTSRYLVMRNARIEGNPRQTDEYQEKCCQAVGVGAEPDKELSLIHI